MTNRRSISTWPLPVMFAGEVLVFEREIEAAVVRGDVGFVDAASAPTFTFTHGDGWTTGGEPLRVDKPRGLAGDGRRTQLREGLTPANIALRTKGVGSPFVRVP